MKENATILAALRSGTIDYAGFNGNSNLRVDQAESLQKTNPEIALTQWAQRSEVAFSFIVTEPPFDDVNVRHAMQMALDLETINDTYYSGFADTTPSQLIGVKGYVFPFAEWPDEVKKFYMYDPAAAEVLLDGAGYPRGTDGVRFNTKLTSLDLFDVDYAELAATYWDAIGVDVEISVLDRPAYMSAMHGLTYGGLLHTIAGYDNDPMTSITWAHSGQIGKSNVTGLQDPVYDALVEAAQAATSTEEQQGLVREIDRCHVENHLRVWGPKVPQFNANQPWVVGFGGEIDLGWGDRSIVFSRLWIDQALGKGIPQMILVLGIAGGIVSSRVVRGAVIGVKENASFDAAEALGSSKWRTRARHVLPNIAAPVIIIFSINVGGVIMAEASLSFLGFGLPPEVPSWGSLLSRGGRQYMEQAPWLALWPGLCLTITGYSLNMFGDAVRDLLDPRLRGGGGRLGGAGAKSA